MRKIPRFCITGSFVRLQHLEVGGQGEDSAHRWVRLRLFGEQAGPMDFGGYNMWGLYPPIGKLIQCTKMIQLDSI